MKKIIILIAVFLAIAGFAEDKKENAVVFGKVFTQFYYMLDSDQEPQSGFELNRAYLGGKKNISDDLSVKITYDVERVDNVVGDGDVDTRYTAYLKIAELTWKNPVPMLDLTLGQHGLRQFAIQEKSWGHRYVEKSSQDKYKFGTSADLGVTAVLKPAGDVVEAHLSILNGEGYKKPQSNEEYKVAGGVAIKPIDGVTVFGYVDALPTVLETQLTASLFAGYSIKDLVSIGAEFNTQSAAKGIKNHDYTNVSLYGSYDIDAQFQLFARYDVTQSKDDWNEKKDGSLLLGGIQASIHKSFLVALNYRSWLSAQNGVDAVNSIEANTQFSF